MYVEWAVAANADRVRLVRGTENGEVSDMSPTEITLNRGQPGSKAIAVNQIKTILFDGEPTELSQARVVSLPRAAKAKLPRLGVSSIHSSGEIQRIFTISKRRR
jgi:hypothetical protein